MVTPPTRLEATLTGRASTRPAIFSRKHILVVEESLQHYSMCPPPPGHKDPAAWREFCKEGPARLRWRDATQDDVRWLGIMRGGHYNEENPTRKGGRYE